jgi:hypothetical protein
MTLPNSVGFPLVCPIGAIVKALPELPNCDKNSASASGLELSK